MRRHNQGDEGSAGSREATGTDAEGQADATVVLLAEFLEQRRAGQQVSPNHPSVREARSRLTVRGQHRGVSPLPAQATPGHDDVDAWGASPLDHAVRDHAEPCDEPCDEPRDDLTYDLRYEEPVDAVAEPWDAGLETPLESLGQIDVAAEPVTALEPRTAPVATVDIPETARWRASNGPRFFAAALLAMATLGVAALALRFEASRTLDDFVSLTIGTGIAVGLWAILIASAPRRVTLRGSVLTLHRRGGYERFDLADGLQPVDVVGDPRRSQWALLLHRPDCSSAVLRRRDVDAVELDPIVRHYRDIAEHRNAEREARFSR